MLDAHFYWRVLGGRWTNKHKHVAVDAATMFARAHARQWCDLYNWSCQNGFALNMYGQDASVQLAKAWTRKAIFCQLWFEAGASEHFQYSKDQPESYVESLPFLDWAVIVDVNSDTFDCIVAVRNHLPRAAE